MTYTIKFFTALVLFSPNLFGQNDTLRLLTWNIFMRPRMVFHDYQLDRARAIVEELKNDDNEIIVFQEIFDRKARKIITKGLKEQYPYQFGPGKKGLFRLNSGVMALSKYDVKQRSIKRYKNCKGGDCMAKKSAVFIEIAPNNKSVQIVGTHLQAGQGTVHKAIRKQQLQKVKKLSDEFYKPDIPMIYAGDMNIRYSDSTSYDMLLDILDIDLSTVAKDPKSTSWDTTFDISEGRTGNPKKIDYVLLRKGNSAAKFVKRQVVTYKKELPNGKFNLSDHRAVKAWMVY